MRFIVTLAFDAANRKWQPLCFFSKILSQAEQKYCAYIYELLATYLAVKHFKQMIGGSTFHNFHKSFSFTFHQKPEKCSPSKF